MEKGCKKSVVTILLAVLACLFASACFLFLPKTKASAEEEVGHSVVGADGVLVLDKIGTTNVDGDYDGSDGDFIYSLDSEWSEIYDLGLSPKAIEEIQKPECTYVKIVIPAGTEYGDITYLSGFKKKVTNALGSDTESINKIKELDFTNSKNTFINNNYCNFPGLVTVKLGPIYKLNSNPFEGCTQLTNVEMPNLTEFDKAQVFVGTPFRDTFVVTEGGFAYYGGILMCVGTGIDRTVTEVTIKEGVKVIAQDTFKDFKNLTTINFPSTLTKIEGWAFRGCTSLTSVVIPNTVTSLGRGIFAGCYKLEELTVPFIGKTAEEQDGQDGYFADTFLGTYGTGTSGVDYYGTNYNYSYAPVSLKKVTITGETVVNPYGFYGMKELTTVILGENVTKICDNAFDACTNLKTVEMSGVNSIGNNAFRGTKYLADITAEAQSKGYLIINGVLSEVYNKSTLTSFDLQDGDTITAIAGGAFQGCSKLTSIDIPETVTSIGTSAFESCSSLTEVTIPSKVKELGQRVFAQCSKLTKITLPVNCKIGVYDGWSSYGTFYGAEVKEIYLIGETQNLYSDFFCDVYTGLESYRLYLNGEEVKEIIIPDGERNIDNYIFTKNISVEKVTVPARVSYIDTDVFNGCNNIKEVHISDLAAWCDISFNSNPLSCNAEGVQLWLNGAHVTTLDFTDTGIETLSENAFSGADIVSVITGDVKYIGDKISYGGNRDVFKNCKQLESLTISDTLEYIGESAFEGCTSLSTVNVDKENSALKTIYKAAFKDCIGLTEFTIPQNVLVSKYPEGIYTSTSNSAFEGCVNIHTVTDWTPIQEDGRTLINVFAKETTNGGVAKYANTVINRNGTNVMLEPDENGYVFYEEGSTNINYLFKYVGTETELTLPVGYKGQKYYIYHDSFNGNKTITKLTILPDSVSVIDKNAFQYCSELTYVEIHGIDEIGDRAFKQCSKLKSVTIFGGTDVIGVESFSGCQVLTDFLINDGEITEIKSSAFYNCKLLGAIRLPDSLTYIGGSAFSGCSNLAIVVMGENVEYIGDAAFAGTAITEITIPSKLEILYISVFADCTKLEKVTFAKDSQLKTIHYSAFENTAIRSIELPDSVTWISAYVFRNCKNLEYIKLPANLDIVKITRQYAPTTQPFMPYYGANNLKTVVLPAALSEKGYTDSEKCDGGWQLMLLNNLYWSQNPENVVFIAPTKEVYDALVAEHAANNAANTTWKDTYGKKLYYVDKFTFTLMKSASAARQGETEVGTVEVELLVNATSVDGDGYVRQANGCWVKTDSALPAKVGMYSVNPADWVYDEGTKSYTQIVDSLAIGVPDDEEIYYGETITVPEVYGDAISIVKIQNSRGATVYQTKPLGVGVYTVTVKPTAGYLWGDSTSDEKTYQVAILPASINVEWSFDGKADFSVQYTGRAGLKALMQATYNGQDFVTIVYLKNDPSKTPLSAITDTGVYVFEVVAASYPDYVIENPTQTLTVTPQVITAADVLDNLTIGLTNGASLGNGLLYIYKDGSNNIVPSYTQLGTGTLVEVINVESSIARYINSELTIAATVRSYSAEKFEVTDTEGDKRTAIGKQQTVFTISAKDNYVFALSSVMNAAALGLDVSVSDDGKTITLTKTWYVVQLGNELLMYNATSESDVYTIIGWTYGDNVTLTLPRLMHGDEGANWQSDNSHVTFTLAKAGVANAIVSNASRSDLLNYINKYMPAGHYTLTVTVAGFDLAAHDNWWSEDNTAAASYPTFSRRYEFDVEKATIAVDKTKYTDYTWELTDNADKQLLFKQFADVIDGAIATVKMEAPEGNYWATTAGKAYFGDYVVTYNFSHMKNETYIAADRTELLGYIDSNIPATYTVYFQITMPNHENLTDTGADGRYGYTFTVTVFKTIAVPTVIDAGLTYTGSKVLPEIDESELYEIVWAADDAYIAGGKHSVSFKLYDNVHYRWKDVTGDTVKVEYTVAKAANAFTVSLNMLGWNFETFDKDVNNVRAAVRFLDNGESIHFRVTKKDETTALTGLTDFAIDGDGRVNETIAALLNALKVGEYTLYAKINGTNNYNELELNIDFAVGKALNSWLDGEDDLILPGWIVGKYNPDENVIVVNAAHGKVNFTITDIDGNEYYNSVTGVNKLNDCEVGKYILKAWVDETEDFAAIERVFTIEVFEKIGLPWWAVLLIVIGSLGLAALIIFILWKKGVFRIVTDKIILAIKTKVSVEATIASVRAAKMAEEGKQSVAEAKRKERIEQMRKKAEEQRALPPEERAAQLEEKAKADEERAEKLRARSEAKRQKAAKMRGEKPEAEAETPATEEPTAEAAATENSEE